MFINLLIIRIKSDIFKSSISAKTIISTLHEFAFQPNGTFFFSISVDEDNTSFVQKYPNGVILALLTQSERSKFITNKKTICQKDFSRVITRIRLVEFSNGKEISSYVEGNISYRSIYTPYIINCVEKKLHVVYSYFNYPNYLDYRQQHYPYIYVTFSIYFLGASLFLLINALSYSNYNVPLHSILLFSHIVMAASYIYTSYHWNYRAKQKNFPQKYIIFERLLASIANLIFYFPPFLAAFGYGIYRLNLKCIEIFPLIRDLLFSIFENNLSLLKQLYGSYFYYIYVCWVGIIFIDLTCMISRYQVLAISIFQSQISRQIVFKMKMIMEFIPFYILILVSKIIFYFFIPLTEDVEMSISQSVFTQVFNIFISILELYFFSYQKSFNEHQDQDQNENLNDMEELLHNAELYQLECPNGKEISFLSS